MSGVLDFPISDHLPVFALIKNQTNALKRKIDKKNEVMWRFFDERKKEKFLSILEENLKSIDQSNHPDKILDELTDATKSAIQTCFPLKKMSNRAKKRALIPWFDTEIFRGEREQSKLFRRFIKSKNPEDHKIYKKFRNMLSKKKYRAKRKYFQDLLNDAKHSGDQGGSVGRFTVIQVVRGVVRKKKNKMTHPPSELPV